MADVVIRERTDEKGLIHRMEIPLKTFLKENGFEAVVRCKDCKWVWCDSEKSQAYHCIETGWSVEPDGYCDMGERR